MGMDHDFLKSGATQIRVDPSVVAVYPRDHRPEGVVVVRVHRGISCVAVPALPPRGCTFGKHVAPRWIGLIQQQAIGDIGTAVVGKGEKQEWSAEESRREVPVVTLDVLYEFFDERG